MMEKENTATADKYDFTERLRSLLQIESNLSDNFRGALNEEARRLLRALIPDANDFFSDDLDTSKHSEEDVRTLVRCIPSVLEYDDEMEEGHIFQRLLENVETLPFIPVVAEEAVRMDYYKDPSLRGGLMALDKNDKITILHSLYGKSEPVISVIVRRLREMGLLKKEDIREQDILFQCDQKLFAFFADWDPGALTTKFIQAGIGRYLHHRFIEIHDNIAELLSRIPVAEVDMPSIPKPFICPYEIIKASFKHYPNELGLLMLSDGEFEEGESFWERLNDVMGSQEAWKMIENAIHETGNDKVFEESSGQGSEVSFAPLFTAAASYLSDDLNILCHLLRQEPAQWISYLEEPYSEPEPEPESDPKRLRDDVILMPSAEQQEVASSRVSKRRKNCE